MAIQNVYFRRGAQGKFSKVNMPKFHPASKLTEPIFTNGASLEDFGKCPRNCGVHRRSHLTKWISVDLWFQLALFCRNISSPRLPSCGDQKGEIQAYLVFLRLCFADTVVSSCLKQIACLKQPCVRQLYQHHFF